MNKGNLTTSTEPETIALQHFSELGSLNRWMFEMIRPYIKGRVLEMGSGSGAFASLLIENEIVLHLNDTEQIYRETLRKKYGGTPIVRGIHKIDFQHPEFEKVYSAMFDVFSTIFSLNISEHIPIDPLSITNAKLLLRRNGHFIVLAPAYTALYDESGQSLEDLKKYNSSAIKNFLGKDLFIMKTRYFNLMRNKSPITVSQMGLSVIAIGRKEKY